VVPALATIPLEEWTTVEGKVTDQNGEPLAGAMLVAIGQGPAISIDNDGSFQLLLPPGKVRILAWRKGYSSFVGELDLAAWMSRVELNVVLETGVCDLGKVTGKVECMPGSSDCRVELPELGLYAYCDQEGNFDFTDIPPGDWRAVAYCDHFTPQIIEAVSLTPGGSQELNFKFIKY
jgi:hypothetical protein